MPRADFLAESDYPLLPCALVATLSTARAAGLRVNGIGQRAAVTSTAVSDGFALPDLFSDALRLLGNMLTASARRPKGNDDSWLAHTANDDLAVPILLNLLLATAASREPPDEAVAPDQAEKPFDLSTLALGCLSTLCETKAACLAAERAGEWKPSLVMLQLPRLTCGPLQRLIPRAPMNRSAFDDVNARPDDLHPLCWQVSLMSIIVRVANRYAGSSVPLNAPILTLRATAFVSILEWLYRLALAQNHGKRERGSLADH